MIGSVLEYINNGGGVSYALVALFLMISYSVGHRLSVLFAGRSVDARHVNLKVASVQAQFAKILETISVKDHIRAKDLIDYNLFVFKGELGKFSTLLNTAVMLAPLLGLLGTVIGMIETFSSLSDADLFSSSGGIAGGISQALITTQLGLIVAIPGVFLSRYLKKIEQKTFNDLLQMSEIHLERGSK